MNEQIGVSRGRLTCSSGMLAFAQKLAYIAGTLNNPRNPQKRALSCRPKRLLTPADGFVLVRL
jgi:hypothetical protein